MGELIQIDRERRTPSTIDDSVPHGLDVWEKLRNAIAADVVEKFPGFVSLRQFAALTNIDVDEVNAMVESGELVTQKRRSRVGLVAADNLDFFRGRRIYNLRTPSGLRIAEDDTKREIAVSSQTYELLWNLALHDRRSIEGVVRGLVSSAVAAMK